MGYKRALSIAVFVSLAGCSAFVSTPAPSFKTPTKSERKTIERVGQFYFLPRLFISIEGTQMKAGENEISGDYQVTVTPIYMADNSPDARYFVRWTPSGLGTDSIRNLKINDAGLLDTVDINVNDQSLPILANVVTIAAKVFTMAAGLPTPASSGARVVETPRENFEIVLDPFNSDQCKEAHDEIFARARLELKISPQNRFGSYATGKDVGAGNQEEPTEKGRDNGLYYRPKVQLYMTLVSTADEEVPVNKLYGFIAPDPSQRICLPFARAAFVDKKQEAIFTNGMVGDIQISQPSMLKGLTDGLLSIVEAASSVVPTIINVKAEQAKADATSEKTLLDSQTALLTSKAELLKAQAALDAAKKPATAAEVDSSAKRKLALRISADAELSEAKLREKQVEEASKKDASKNNASPTPLPIPLRTDVQ